MQPERSDVGDPIDIAGRNADARSDFTDTNRLTRVHPYMMERYLADGSIGQSVEEECEHGAGKIHTYGVEEQVEKEGILVSESARRNLESNMGMDLMLESERVKKPKNKTRNKKRRFQKMETEDDKTPLLPEIGHMPADQSRLAGQTIVEAPPAERSEVKIDTAAAADSGHQRVADSGHQRIPDLSPHVPEHRAPPSSSPSSMVQPPTTLPFLPQHPPATDYVRETNPSPTEDYIRETSFSPCFAAHSPLPPPPSLPSLPLNLPISAPSTLPYVQLNRQPIATSPPQERPLFPGKTIDTTEANGGRQSQATSPGFDIGGLESTAMQLPSGLSGWLEFPTLAERDTEPNFTSAPLDFEHSWRTQDSANTTSGYISSSPSTRRSPLRFDELSACNSGASSAKLSSFQLDSLSSYTSDLSTVLQLNSPNCELTPLQELVPDFEAPKSNQRAFELTPLQDLIPDLEVTESNQRAFELTPLQDLTPDFEAKESRRSNSTDERYSSKVPDNVSTALRELESENGSINGDNKSDSDSSSVTNSSVFTASGVETSGHFDRCDGVGGRGNNTITSRSSYGSEGSPERLLSGGSGLAGTISSPHCRRESDYSEGYQSMVQTPAPVHDDSAPVAFQFPSVERGTSFAPSFVWDHQLGTGFTSLIDTPLNHGNGELQGNSYENISSDLGEVRFGFHISVQQPALEGPGY